MVFLNPYMSSSTEPKVKLDDLTKLFLLLEDKFFQEAKKFIEKNSIDLNTLIFIDEETVFLGGKLTGYPLIYYFIFTDNFLAVKFLVDNGATPNLLFCDGLMRPLDGIKLLNLNQKINMFFSYLKFFVTSEDWTEENINKNHLKYLKLITPYYKNCQEFVFLKDKLYTFND